MAEKEKDQYLDKDGLKFYDGVQKQRFNNITGTGTGTLESRVKALETDNAANKENISTNKANISTLTTAVSKLETELMGVSSIITSIEGKI